MPIVGCLAESAASLRAEFALPTWPRVVEQHTLAEKTAYFVGYLFADVGEASDDLMPEHYREMVIRTTETTDCFTVSDTNAASLDQK
jgi:hypothetical protein